MAAQVAIEGLAQAALVMSMRLGKGLQDRWIKLALDVKANSKPPKLYLAPMPQDQATLARSRGNFKAMSAVGQYSNRIVLDTQTCVPEPVTEEFLLGRVPGLTREESTVIVKALIETGHVDAQSQLFVRDPTQSNWREVLLKLSSPSSRHPIGIVPQGVLESEILWGHLVLTRGLSPLTKAFHRAWAFHEYCSEAVPPALAFFLRED